MARPTSNCMRSSELRAVRRAAMGNRTAQAVYDSAWRRRPTTARGRQTTVHGAWRRTTARGERLRSARRAKAHGAGIERRR
eukprot:6096545-Pleurochrysis_carterae.AAC.1